MCVHQLTNSLRQPYLQFWDRPAFYRFKAEFGAFAQSLPQVSGTPGTEGAPPDWRTEVELHLKAAAACCTKQIYDLDGAWAYLQAAKRARLEELDEKAVKLYVVQLRETLPKISPRRRKEAEAVLGSENTVSTAMLQRACEIRDEHYQNVYHRIGLLGYHLAMLSWMALGFFVILLAVFCWTGPLSSANISAATILSSGIAGALGACVSGLQSLAGKTDSTTPERVVNASVTFARVIGGIICGLFGYLAYSSGLIAVKVVGDTNNLAWIAVALLAGFAGDRPIANVAGRVLQSDRT